MTKPITRREVLKSGTITTGAVFFSGVASGSDVVSESAIDHGYRDIFDMKVTHEITHNDLPTIQADNFIAPTRVWDGKLFAVGISHGQIVDQSPYLVRTPEGISHFNSTYTFRQNHMYRTASYNGQSSAIIFPEESYNPFSLETTVIDGEMMVDLPENDRETVRTESEELVDLPQKKIGIKKLGDPIKKTFERTDSTITRTMRPQIGTERVSVTPSLGMKNHGGLEVYSAENAITGPQDAPWMRKHISSAKQDGRSVTRVEGTDLLVISQGVSQ